MKTMLKKVAGVALALSLAVDGAHAQQVLFWSTQARPVEETQKMRDEVLKGFDGPVDYQVAEDGPWLTRLQAELQAGSGTIGLLGGLHGDFSPSAPALPTCLASMSEESRSMRPTRSLACSAPANRNTCPGCRRPF